MLGVQVIAAFSVSEQVVVKVYSILVIAVDIETVWESDPLAEVRVPEIVHDTVGHVPQTGLLASVRADEEVVKSVGSVLIFETHHPYMSSLKDDAL